MVVALRGAATHLDGAPAGGAPVAVCTLGSPELIPPLAGHPGVARAGPLATANLGIEALVRSVVADPAIRFVLLCGTDSVLFRPGQTLLALARNGVDAAERRVLGAEGYRPVLRGLRPAEIDHFRAQVLLVDRRGVRDVGELERAVDTLRSRGLELGAYRPDAQAATPPVTPGTAPGPFRRLHPGGRRSPLSSTCGSFFVISVDRRHHEVVVRQYRHDLTPEHELRGVRAESMLLGLLRAGAVEDPSHAGYLGGELTKAETALRLSLPYEQDCPLRLPGMAYESSAPR